jgi:hypothetical protein
MVWWWCYPVSEWASSNRGVMPSSRGVYRFVEVDSSIDGINIVVNTLISAPNCPFSSISSLHHSSLLLWIPHTLNPGSYVGTVCYYRSSDGSEALTTPHLPRISGNELATCGKLRPPSFPCSRDLDATPAPDLQTCQSIANQSPIRCTGYGMYSISKYGTDK